MKSIKLVDVVNASMEKKIEMFRDIVSTSNLEKYSTSNLEYYIIPVEKTLMLYIPASNEVYGVLSKESAKEIVDMQALKVQTFLESVEQTAQEMKIDSFFIAADGFSMTRNNNNEVISKLRNKLKEIEISLGQDPEHDWKK